MEYWDATLSNGNGEGYNDGEGYTGGPGNGNTNLKRYIAERKALRKIALNSFSLRGTRRLQPPISRPHYPPDVLPAGKRFDPKVSYVREVSNEYLGHGKYNRFYPPLASNIIADRSFKSKYLRDSHLIRPVDPDSKTAEWIEMQRQYINDLSHRDRQILNSYTSHGDRIINSFCRGRLNEFGTLLQKIIEEDFNLPLAYSIYDQFDRYKDRIALASIDSADKLLTADAKIDMNKIRNLISVNLDFFRDADNIVSLLEQYKQDLIRIISSSPRPQKPIVVYRGIGDEKYLNSPTFLTKDFYSTTLYPRAATKFAKQFKHQASFSVTTPFIGGIYELTVSPSVPCIYMEFITAYTGEYEVLIPPGMEITFENKMFMKKLFKNDYVKATTLSEPADQEVVTIHGIIKRPRGSTKKPKYHNITGNVKHRKTLRKTKERSPPPSQPSFSKKKFRRWSRRNKKGSLPLSPVLEEEEEEED